MVGKVNLDEGRGREAKKAEYILSFCFPFQSQICFSRAEAAQRGTTTEELAIDPLSGGTHPLAIKVKN